MSETDSGGELSVDHHRPVAAGGDDSDDNLVYTCWRCNLHKGDFFPTEEDLASGRRLLHPLKDNVNLHIALNVLTGRVEGKTPTGRFHIELLHLNRPALVAHRIRRRLETAHEAAADLRQEEINHLRQLLAAHLRYINRLRLLLGLPPWPEG